MSTKTPALTLTVATSRRVSGEGINIESKVDFVEDITANRDSCSVYIEKCLEKLRAGEIDGVHILRTL